MKQNTLLASLCLAAACVCAQSTPDQNHFAVAFSNAVTRASALVENADKAFPEHFRHENAIRRGTEFDPNSFFSILTHLKIRNGVTLDYVYRYTGLGGWPCLYVRPQNGERLATFEQYKATYPDGVTQAARLKHIETDASVEALAELMAFVEYHTYFYNRWHDWLHKEIILSDKQMRAVLDKWWKEPASFDTLEPKERAKALATSLSPTLVPSSDGQVDISFVLFAEGQGILERKYTVTTASPHEVVSCTNHVIVTQGAMVR